MVSKDSNLDSDGLQILNDHLLEAMEGQIPASEALQKLVTACETVSQQRHPARSGQI